MEEELAMDPEIKAALDKLFTSDSSLYQERGFQRRIGWGENGSQHEGYYPWWTGTIMIR